MKNHEHERATELIARRGTEELTAADVSWLDTHLASCDECNEYARAFESAGRLVRSTTIMASAGLVAGTQARVRARAQHMEEHRSRTVLIAMSFCLGALSSAFSAWLWWRFGGWVVDEFGLSPALVGPGIMLFLLLPAVVMAGVMLAFPHHALEHSRVAAWLGEREGGTQ